MVNHVHAHAQLRITLSHSRAHIQTRTARTQSNTGRARKPNPNPTQTKSAERHILVSCESKDMCDMHKLIKLNPFGVRKIVTSEVLGMCVLVVPPLCVRLLEDQTPRVHRISRFFRD